MPPMPRVPLGMSTPVLENDAIAPVLAIPVPMVSVLGRYMKYPPSGIQPIPPPVVYALLAHPRSNTSELAALEISMPHDWPLPDPLPMRFTSRAPEAVGVMVMVAGVRAAGRSAATSARNVGAAFEPDVGPASRVFLVWVANAGVRVPLVVTGVSALAVKMVPSPVQETEVTVPLVMPAIESSVENWMRLSVPALPIVVSDVSRMSTSSAA